MSNKAAKEERLYVRVTSEIKNNFELLAEYKGLNPSALLHSMIVKSIREAREEKPTIFETKAISLNEAMRDNEHKKK